MVTWGLIRPLSRRLSRETDEIRHLLQGNQPLLEQQEQLRLKILEEVARGLSLPQVLHDLVLYVESVMPDTLCSVLLLDESGSRLQLGAAPSLPDFYNTAIDGLQIGPGVGSCGAAAYENRLIVVEEIQRHPNWSAFANLAVRAQLAACWSQPIHDSQHKVLGTLAVYHRTPRSPDPEELDLVGPLTDLAGLAIERTRHQRRLAKEEAWRRILLEQSKDGIVILDDQGMVHEANNGFVDMLGYSMEEIRQLAVWDWDALLSKEQLMLALQSIDEEGDHFETRQRRKDGNLIDVEISTNAAVFDGKKLIFCLCRDVTQRKLGEQALRLSEERFDLAMRAANDGLWDWNLQTDAAYYSPRWKEMLGYSDRELANELATWERLIDPEDKTRAMTLLEEIWAGRRDGFNIEFRMRHKAGHWVHVLSRGTLLRDEENQPLRMVGTHLDITAQKRLEQRLRDSEVQANLIIDTAPDGIIVTNSMGRIVRVNPRVKALFGYTKEELLGHTVEILMPDTLRSAHVQKREDYMEQPVYRRPRNYDISVPMLGLRKDGSEFPMELGLSPFSIGNEDHVVVTVRDISDRIAAEKALRDSDLRFRTLFELSPDPAWIIEGYEFVECNEAAVRILGYKNKVELMNTHPAMLSPALQPDGQDSMVKAEQMMDRAREKGTHRFEWLHKRVDDSTFFAEVTLSTITLQNRQVIYCAWRDITDRKEAEAKVRESETRFRTMFEGAQDGIIVVDLELRDIIFVNPMICEMTGYRMEEMLSLKVTDIHPHEQLAYVMDQFDRQARGEFVMAEDMPVQRKDGSVFPADISVSQVNLDGRPCLAGFFRDITERKRSQDELNAYRQNLEQLVAERTAKVQLQARIIDQSHDSIVTTDLDGFIIGWNRGAAKMFGISEEAALGEHISLVFPPDQREFLQNEVIETLRRKGRNEVEVKMWRADGEEFYAHLSLSLLHEDDGKLSGMIGYSTDITARKQMEQALRASESNLAQAQAIAHLGSWHFDLLNHRLSGSNEIYQIFGLESGSALTLGHFIAYLHPEDIDAVQEAWQAAQWGSGYDIEHRLLVNGEQKWVRARAEARRDSQGQVVSVLGTVQDISERKLAEQATQEALIEAQRLAKVRSEFVANMSHEIRTPLSGVLGLARMGEGEIPAEKSREIFQRIRKSGQHLLNVINDILDFSKIEAGKLSLENAPFELLVSVDNTVEVIRSLLEEKGLSFHLQLAEGLPDWVSGDALRLEQVLLNLLSNAVKFTEQGEVSLGVMPQGDGVAFAVSDTGVGMSQNQVERLFQPFEQGDSSMTRRYGGTGLGLSISFHLARMMGGDIRVQSQEHVGSEFTLRLPLQSTTPATVISDTLPQVNGGRLRGIRVLVAEDVEVNRIVLADLMEQEGAQLQFAENGQQALEAIERQDANALDVVLMDVQMPIMDGYDATRRIHVLRPDLPVIGLTAHALAEDRERCLASGMLDHVTKPIDEQILVKTILRYAAPAPQDADAPGSKPVDADQQAQSLSVPSEGEPVIDMTALRARFQGREVFIKKLMGIAITSFQETPEKLRQAAQSGDLDQLKFIAHSLKGVSGNLEARLLHRLALQVEGHAKQGHDETCHRAIELATALDDLLSVLTQQTKAS